MIILELFSGTESFSKVARELGHKTFTVDFDKSFNPDLCIDILDFDVSMLPEEFRNLDILWASPPCQTFSVSSVYHHWSYENGIRIPKSQDALIGLRIIEKTKQLIKELNPKFFFIENPRGVLRKVINLGIDPITVTYCQYGDSRMKPTDIWTNTSFKGRRCNNRDNCHQSSPRGSRTGTQGLKNPKIKAVIPRNLCLEIIKYCEEEDKKI